jgi:hypothetical protein
MAIIKAPRIAVQDETVLQGRARTLNFAGAGVSAAIAGDVATVTIPGGSAGVSYPVAALWYKYDNSVFTDTNPGNGNFTMNNLDPSLVTQLYINFTDAGNVTMKPVTDLWSSWGGIPYRGFLNIAFTAAGPPNGAAAQYFLTGQHAGAGQWTVFDVVYYSHSNTSVSGDAYLMFERLSPLYGTATVNLGSAPRARRSGRTAIAGFSGLTAGRVVEVTQNAGPYPGKGARADESEMDGIDFVGTVRNATTVDVYWESKHRVRGNYNVAYAIQY